MEAPEVSIPDPVLESLVVESRREGDFLEDEEAVPMMGWDL